MAEGSNRRLDREKEKTGVVNEGGLENMYGARYVNGVYVADQWISRIIFRNSEKEAKRILKFLFGV